MRVVHAGVVASFVACSTLLFAQAGPRRDGNWEVTMEMQMPNMPPGMSMPPMKVNQCITKEEAADPQKALPQQPTGRGGPPPDCKVSDFKTEGNRVTWTVKCTGAQAMDATGDVVYTADTFAGTMKMNMERNGQPMSMTTKYTGKRLGDCVK